MPEREEMREDLLLQIWAMTLIQLTWPCTLHDASPGRCLELDRFCRLSAEASIHYDMCCFDCSILGSHFHAVFTLEVVSWKASIIRIYKHLICHWDAEKKCTGVRVGRAGAAQQGIAPGALSRICAKGELFSVPASMGPRLTKRHEIQRERHRAGEEFPLTV